MRDRSGFGWLALIVSILLVLLGIATFIWPAVSYTHLTLPTNREV